MGRRGAVSLAPEAPRAPCRPAAHLVDHFLLLGVFLPQAGHLPPQGLVLAVRHHCCQLQEARAGGGGSLRHPAMGCASGTWPHAGCGVAV